MINRDENPNQDDASAGDGESLLFRSKLIDENTWTGTSEQLFNKGRIGSFWSVRACESKVTSLRGILLNFNSRLLQPRLTKPFADSERKELLRPTKKTPLFYTDFLRPILNRHYLFKAAEIKCCGYQIQAIIRFPAPVQIRSKDDRDFWRKTIALVQQLLPTTPDWGSLNAIAPSFDGISNVFYPKIMRIKGGRQIGIEAVLGIVREFEKSPFMLVSNLLFGVGRVSPCPKCHGEGTQLDCFDQFGKCSGQCGLVTLEQLWDAIYITPRSGIDHDEA